MADEPDLSLLLSRFRRGDHAAGEELMPRIEAEMHRLAQGAMQRQRPGHTLQPTALVHEAWMRLFRGTGEAPGWQDRAHFFGAAARTMRHILVDAVRARRAAKRGRRAELEGGQLGLFFAADEEPAGDPLDVHEALEALALHDAQLARLLELRFFGGLSIDETAEVLGVSPSTVDRGWRVARAWMRTRLASLEEDA